MIIQEIIFHSRTIIANLLFLIVFLFVVSGCDFHNHSDHSKIVFSNAVSYNQYIITRQNELMEDVNTFNLASEHNYSLAIKLLDTILLHSAQSAEDIKVLAPFKKDSSFKETAIDVFNFYNKIFVPYSRKMIPIKMKIDSGIAVDSDYNIYNDYVKKITRQSGPIEKRLVDIQVRFAKRNNFLLTKNAKKDE